MTQRAEEVIKQTVVHAEAIHDEKIRDVTAEANAVISKERHDKEAAIQYAQQSQRRVLELEDAANKGNEYVHGLQQQAIAHGQSATQKIQLLNAVIRHSRMRSSESWSKLTSKSEHCSNE